MLPIVREAKEESEEEARREFLFEPQAGEVLKALLPTYIRTLVYRAFLESIASEHAARRAAMKNATDNAEEMIKTLTLQFNKARQAQITQEITEISTSAEAVKIKKIRER
jgi:F-type H+-transporting ATPase subunit gamma